MDKKITILDLKEMKEKGEKITRVPRETIEELARSIAGAKGASLLMYTGLEYSNSGVQNIRAVLSLWAITDNIDVPGGLVFRPRSPVRFCRVILTRSRPC